MACSGIHYTGASFLRQQPGDGLINDQSQPTKVPMFTHPKIPNLAVNPPFPRFSTSATATANFYGGFDLYESGSSPFAFESNVESVDDDLKENILVSEKIDEWMRNSVTEIVKNINQAPLLVQIYANGDVKTEKKVKAEAWPDVVKEKTSLPDGVILVEELHDKNDLDINDNNINKGEGTKAFGVVIQGKFKGRDYRCKSACYLLKTSSVNGGMGRFCTHFCLMKVGSFSKSAALQLTDCWLLP